MQISWNCPEQALQLKRHGKQYPVTDNPNPGLQEEQATLLLVWFASWVLDRLKQVWQLIGQGKHTWLIIPYPGGQLVHIVAFVDEQVKQLLVALQIVQLLFDHIALL